MATANKTKAVYLDSDGVLNTAIIKNNMPCAPTSLAEFSIPDEVKPALDKLKAAGFLLICVTNKPDIERGLIKREVVDQIYINMRQILPLDDVFICYSGDYADPSYKPNPGLLIAAAEKYNIDFSKSYMVGDRWRDIGAGKNVNCKTIWINRHYAEENPTPSADHEVSSLMEAATWILSDCEIN